MFKREFWIARKMAPINPGSYKSMNSKDTMTRILLTLHIGLGKEMTVILFLILLNSNKLREPQKYASVISLYFSSANLCI